MQQNPASNRNTGNLFPPLDPFDQMRLDVGDGHTVYVEQCGTPHGLPVIVLHGGPGGGCSPAMRRYFDPKVWRIILFDQRGCGRSRPYASVAVNTTWHLVADIERIRNALGVNRWAVFGGSWGATLALAYAISHPERVGYLALRGVFLMMQRELDWFYSGGAGQFWPEAWAKFLSPLPERAPQDVIAAYSKHLFSGDLREETRFARYWAAWENRLASMRNTGHDGESPGEYARAFARLECHYFLHKGWFEADGWLLNNIKAISDIPGVIVQGRYDMICPPRSAYDLAQVWKRGDLKIVPNAGHALSEPGISRELVQAMVNAASDDLGLA